MTTRVMGTFGSVSSAFDLFQTVNWASSTGSI